MSNPFEQVKGADSHINKQVGINDRHLQNVLDEHRNAMQAKTGPLAECSSKHLENAAKDLPSLELVDRRKQVPSAKSSARSEGESRPTNSRRQDSCIEIKGPAGVTDCFPPQLTGR